MIDVWHVKYKAASESIIRRSHHRVTDNLRDIISVELRIPEWLEITAGYSLEQYRSLDVQLEGWGGMRHFEACYLINSAEADSDRIVPSPAEWANCRHLSASGWRPPYGDFSYHEVLRAKSRL